MNLSILTFFAQLIQRKSVEQSVEFCSLFWCKTKFICVLSQSVWSSNRKQGCFLFYFGFIVIQTHFSGFLAQHQNALKSHVEILASPLYEGRLTGTIGQKLAAIYLQNHFDSIIIDPFKIVHIEHGGWLASDFDTLRFKQDFFYSGLQQPSSGTLSLDSFQVIECQAVELFHLRKVKSTKNQLFIIRDWDEFLELFGHVFFEVEDALSQDMSPISPMELFVNKNRWIESKSFNFKFIENHEIRYTENLICPIYQNATNKSHWILSAHYDHLGVSGKTYYPGADDNASGVALLLELAQRIRDTELPINLSLIFFSGEEQGLLGSRYFVEYSPYFAEDITRCLNFDMVGFVKKNKIEIIRYQNAPELYVPNNNILNIEIQSIEQEAFLHEFSSDHQSFSDKKIPSYLFFTGLHQYYHTPQDTPENLDYDAMNDLLNVVYELLKNEQ